MNTKNLLLTLAVGVMAMSCNSGASHSTSASLKTTADSVAFYLGYMSGMDLLQNGINEKSLSQDAYMAGMNSAFQGIEIKDDQQQISMMMRNFMQKSMMEAAEANQKEGEEFLKANAKKSGIDTLAGGVQYKILKAGEGPKPGAEDVVKVAYVGKLINGKAFNTRLGEDAVEFGVSQVIPGWTAALKEMPVGSKWELYIPANMAYGPRPNGPIPANSTLIFEMELLDIVKADTTQPAMVEEPLQ